MAAEVKARITLDRSKFEASARRVQQSSSKMGAALKKMAKVGAAVAAAGIAAVGAAAVVAGAKIAAGVKKVFDYGSALSDLREQTGIGVDSLVVLQRAFEDAGISSEKVGRTINKLQKSVGDLGRGLSTQVAAFGALGLAYEDLIHLKPDQLFDAVNDKLAAMENITKRNAIAMDIFGGKAGELAALYSNGGAIDAAAASMGMQAALLAKNADRFDRIADLMNGLKDKFQGFFLGIADVFAGDVQDALELFNAIDFTAIGQKMGQALKAGAEIVTGAFTNLEGAFNAVELGMKLAFMNSVDFLVEEFKKRFNWKEVIQRIFEGSPLSGFKAQRNLLGFGAGDDERDAQKGALGEALQAQLQELRGGGRAAIVDAKGRAAEAITGGNPMAGVERKLDQLISVLTGNLAVAGDEG